MFLKEKRVEKSNDFVCYFIEIKEKFHIQQKFQPPKKFLLLFNSQLCLNSQCALVVVISDVEMSPISPSNPHLTLIFL